MGLVIDTSVLIAAERGEVDFAQWQSYGDAYISSVTITELLIGVHRANTEERRIKRSAFVEHIIGSLTNLVFGEEEARVYAQILKNLFGGLKILKKHWPEFIDKQIIMIHLIFRIQK